MSHPTFLLTVATSFLALWASHAYAQSDPLGLPPGGAAPDSAPALAESPSRPALITVGHCLKRRPHILIRILPRYRPHPRAERIRHKYRTRRAARHHDRNPEVPHGPGCEGNNCRMPQLHNSATLRLRPRSHFH